ncbi:hypothetical protein GCK72_009227 [Caenorhabditis remanei]|uniref:CYtochrome P450 family n=1 Tax=Caenorhabditis remanei TaxID=31234 RepID=A0A6A5H2G2_CAERE|nr:hypothetical protein GCK72_009227 [Caenorhabditis remanei]KAF1760974.1 hypothetical protein GCK72_009227 [Caenorhabditis remanei]
MAFFILSSIFFIFLTFLLHAIYNRRQKLKLRAKIGLDGPEPHWFLGNLKDIIDRTTLMGYNNAHDWHLEMRKKYGDRYAIFFGQKLDIFLCNEDDIKEVFIKNFSNFSDRGVIEIFRETKLNASLLQNTYATGWKHTRSAIAPIFATGKMKAMHETINSKIETFLEILKEKSESGEKWDIYDDFQGLTLDVIGKCAFAIDSNCQRDRNDVFYVEARKFFHNIDLRHSPLVSTSVMIPELMWLWKFLYKFTGLASAELPLVNGLDDVYERRRGGEGSDSVDLLKLLLDREDDKTKGMTKQEVIENCFAFLLAGYETTSTAMTYCSYLLSKYPEVQQKLNEEIEETKRTKQGGLNYDSIHQMKYLDAVYKETLRYYPPVIHFISRTCLKDITINGQFYPKGCAVTVQANTVHRNEANWENPDEFNPDRFLDTNEDRSSTTQLKWIPFGVGPRYCVGMRFAEMEFKTTIAKLIEKFELSVIKGEPDLIPDCNGVIMRPKDPVRLNLKLRK